ncbi:MAG TPA: bile acid:sodium symporter family protein [Nocardioides sp.]|nr:bile acid:sodium symporter family protein [Nocardioides sp.]
MDSALATIGLPIALAVIMFGLGLGLSGEDFRRVGQRPKAIAVALACQLVLLPAVCFALVVLADLPAVLGIGMMLLAASPGGTTANLMSHLFHGDVALNISLTAVNSIISIVTLPIVTGLAIAYYDRGDEVSVPFGEVLKVFVIILVPVGIGMFVRARNATFAARMDRPVRMLSAVLLGLLVVAILVDERDNIEGYFADIGLVAAAFCAISLVVGYVVPKAFGVVEKQAIASSFEIGLHNGTLAIFIAVEVLGSVTFSVPAAVYSLVMLPLAALWGMYVTRRVRRPVTA